MEATSGPLVSVMILSYNLEYCLSRCIESVLDQTYGNLEIILVDDGSEDRSREIAAEYEKKDPRLRLICRGNGGVSAARNTAIDNARGEWLTFVDGDDLIEPDAVECLLSEALEKGVNMSMGAHFVVGSRGKTRVRVTPAVCRTAREAQALFAGPDRYFSFPWGKLYNKEIFDSVSYPEGMIYEDLWTVTHILDAAGSCAVMDRPLYSYCLNPSSVTYSGSIEKQLQGLRAREAALGFYNEYYPELSGKGRDAVLEFAFFLLGRAYRAGRKNNEKSIKKLNETIRSYLKDAPLETVQLRLSKFLFTLSPALTGRVCELYSAVKNKT